MKGKVIILGYMDTKGEEYGFIKKNIENSGLETILIDTGIIGEPAVKPDISNYEVAKAAGEDLQSLKKTDCTREKITPIMAEGAKNIVLNLIKEGKAQGIISCGGTQGTTLATFIMRALPVGFPKVMVSTMASGNTSNLVDIKDIVMVPSIADILGLNRITRKILREASGAICGMVQIGQETNVIENKLVAITNVGITTPGAMKAKEVIENAGFETIVFHAVGSGGRAMESLMEEGQISGVLDLATIEVMQQLTGGILASNSERMTVAGKYGIPQVLVPGGIPVTTFSPHESIPQHLKDRKYVRHNPMFTNILNNRDEFIACAKEQAKRVNPSKGPVEWFIPMKGFCSYSTVGQIFYEPESNKAYVETLRKESRKDININIIEMDINDPGFATIVAQKLIEMLKNKKS